MIFTQRILALQGSVEEGKGTKRNKLIESSAKGTDGRGTSKRLEEGGRSLNTVKEMRRRAMKEFDSFQS
jgi:NADH:ubiquinone oxidoreductase subunit F (NADH-binding)